MSILIKGMEMPRDGEMIDLVITSDGVVRAYDNENEKIGEAVELPEHGALIDRDAYRRAAGMAANCEECSRKRYRKHYASILICSAARECDLLDKAPVVIPAERSEDGET